MWLVDSEKNIAMSCLPKNASQSLKAHFKDQPVGHEEVLYIPIRVVWLQNPMRRLVSGYSFYKAHHERGSTVDVPGEAVESWEAWVDYTFSINDPHWNPQVPQLTHNGEFIGTVVEKFEDIRHSWGRYYKGFLPHVNGCVHEPVWEYKEEEINKKYKEDFYLWQSL